MLHESHRSYPSRWRSCFLLDDNCAPPPGIIRANDLTHSLLSDGRARSWVKDRVVKTWGFLPRWISLKNAVKTVNKMAVFWQCRQTVKHWQFWWPFLNLLLSGREESPSVKQQQHMDWKDTQRFCVSQTREGSKHI